LWSCTGEGVDGVGVSGGVALGVGELDAVGDEVRWAGGERCGEGVAQGCGSGVAVGGGREGLRSEAGDGEAGSGIDGAAELGGDSFGPQGEMVSGALGQVEAELDDVAAARGGELGRGAGKVERRCAGWAWAGAADHAEADGSERSCEGEGGSSRPAATGIRQHDSERSIWCV